MAQKPKFLFDEASGVPARRAALKLLDAVLRRGETLEQAGGAANGLPNPADRALAKAIANETLRWLVDLDALIDSATKSRLPDDAKPRMVLRMMLVQSLRLETPPHAVVATGLELLAGGPRRLAHGVFSALTKKGAKLPEFPTLPDNAWARWGEKGPQIAMGLAEPPPLDLTLRDPSQTAHWAQRLGGISLATGHIRLPRGQRVEELEGFADGAWWVQDLAASLPARLLGEGQGRKVLDLCAAPGGKTMQLAAAGWDVTALDIQEKRLKTLAANLDRTGLQAQIVHADALQWEPDAPFDAILLDAPCSATGTCRRHPDVLHRIYPRHIGEMVEIQRKLLERASGWLKDGGQMVYAVCSLEEREGEAMATQSDLHPSPVQAKELPQNIAPDPQGWVRTHPGMLAEQGGLDGFFIARFSK